MKKRIILIIVAVVIIIGAGGAYGYNMYTTNQLVSKFGTYLADINVDMRNYYLTGEEKTQLNKLIEQGNAALIDSDKTTIKETKLLLEDLKSTVIEENKAVVDELSKYIRYYNLDTYILTDEEKIQINTLLSDSNQAITDNNATKAQAIKVDLDTLKNIVVNKNMQTVNHEIAEIKAINISKLDDKVFIDTVLSEINQLIASANFKEANDKAASLKENINTKIAELKITVGEAKQSIINNYRRNADLPYEYIEEVNASGPYSDDSIIGMVELFYKYSGVKENLYKFGIKQTNKSDSWYIGYICVGTSTGKVYEFDTGGSTSCGITHYKSGEGIECWSWTNPNQGEGGGWSYTDLITNEWKHLEK